MFNIAEDIFVGADYSGFYRDVIPVVSLFMTNKKNEEYKNHMMKIEEEKYNAFLE
mgnify:CR=1 FL=1